MVSSDGGYSIKDLTNHKSNTVKRSLVSHSSVGPSLLVMYISGKGRLALYEDVISSRRGKLRCYELEMQHR